MSFFFSSNPPVFNPPVTFRCARCQLNFSSQADLARHLNESPNHNFCGLCGTNSQDYATYAELQQHRETVHLYCDACNFFAPSEVGLTQHNTAKHNKCATCGDYFLTPHELNGHALSHRPRNVSCYCCDEQFTTLSAMFNHLESGNCPSGITADNLRQLTLQFMLQSNPFLVNAMYYCRGCHRSFQRLCDLLQHAESSCTDSYWGGDSSLGRQIEYIKNNIDSMITVDDNGSSSGSDTVVPENRNNNSNDNIFANATGNVFSSNLFSSGSSTVVPGSSNNNIFANATGNVFGNNPFSSGPNTVVPGNSNNNIFANATGNVFDNNPFQQPQNLFSSGSNTAVPGNSNNNSSSNNNIFANATGNVFDKNPFQQT